MANCEDEKRRATRGNGDVEEIARSVVHGEEDVKIRAAKEIRMMTKKSAKSRAHLAAAGVIGPLVEMLRSDNMEAKESAVLALLNLAVKNERNKVAIGKAGVIELLVDLLESENGHMKEYAAAAILTLSASAVNKHAIGSSGAIKLLVELLTIGSYQGKVDAVMALYNLSTYPDNLTAILDAGPVPALIALLKEGRKSSKVAEKISSLLESLSAYEEGRTSVLKEEGGILALVEVIEDGSLQSREHAVGALLTMCQSNKYNYREAILKEGVIPGLLELTIQGTPKAQEKARNLLQSLREFSSLKRNGSKPISLESIVYNFDGGEKGNEVAKKLFKEMVQASMEQSMSHHLQQTALVCIPSEFTRTNNLSKVPSV
uniref:U-box domain-containing protein n=1 Tax=Araucaria cunninghamii TaxID=56994 RepID=A0A0D6QSP8_ARACU